jgi:hypothetical protein
MNERIKELMLEAGYAAPELAGRANKLAELIVEECANLFKRTHTDEEYQRRIDKTIRKHFGVEELQQPIDFETQDPETAKGTKVEQFGVEE